MINYSQMTDESLIEKEICEKMKNFKKYPMNEDLTDMFIRLSFMDKNVLNIDEKEKPFLMKLIEKRIEYSHTFKINDNRLLLLLSFIVETPGNAILYLWYLQYWCFKNNVSELTWEDFCMKIFPDGFFNNTDLSNIWDYQKTFDDLKNGKILQSNLVDYNFCGNSIHFRDNF